MHFHTSQLLSLNSYVIRYNYNYIYNYVRVDNYNFFLILYYIIFTWSFFECDRYINLNCVCVCVSRKVLIIIFKNMCVYIRFKKITNRSFSNIHHV